MSNKTQSHDLSKGQSLWSDAWARLKKNKMAMASLIVLFVIGVLCFILPAFSIIADPNNQNLNSTFLDSRQKPLARHRPVRQRPSSTLALWRPNFAPRGHYRHHGIRHHWPHLWGYCGLRRRQDRQPDDAHCRHPLRPTFSRFGYFVLLADLRTRQGTYRSACQLWPEQEVFIKKFINLGALIYRYRRTRLAHHGACRQSSGPLSQETGICRSRGLAGTQPPPEYSCDTSCPTCLALLLFMPPLRFRVLS